MTAQSPARLTGSPAVRGQLPLTPGRWLALFIGVPVLLILIGFTGVNFVALAGQGSYPVRDTIPVLDGQVTARVNSGNIELRQSAAAGGTAQMTGTAHYSLFRQKLEVSGSTVTYPCHIPVGDCSLNATLQVPAGTAVSLFTFGGDAAIPSFARSQLTLNTDGGNVTAGSLDGNLDLSTGGGDLTATKLEGSVSVRTDGGNLGVQALEAANPTIFTGGGDVFLVCVTAPHNLLIRSDGGNVTLVLPHGAYSVSTNADGGNVNNAIVSQSGATNLITVDSGGGDINIHAAS